MSLRPPGSPKTPLAGVHRGDRARPVLRTKKDTNRLELREVTATPAPPAPRVRREGEVSEMPPFPVTHRPAKPLDLPFLFATWLKAYRKALPLVPAALYYDRQHAIVANLLAKGVVVVAHPEGDEDTILGWVCSEPGQVLHAGYVKRTWRNLGIFRTICTASAIDLDGPGEYTHLFPEFDAARLPGWHHNPFLLH